MIRIHAILGRARPLKASLKELCDAAGVDHSAPYRWIAGDNAPRLDVYNETCGRLEQELTRREEAMRRHLAALAGERGAA